MENVYFVWALIAVGIGVIYSAYNWFKMPTKSQINNIKEWLLYATLEAEKELGSGTGQMKLRLVYDRFLDRFGWSGKLIPFAMFSSFVSEVLEETKELLETNKDIRRTILHSEEHKEEE